MKNYKQIKRELLKDKEVKKAYKALEPEFALAAALIKKRIEKGLSQKQLAQRIGTQQSAIARLESGSYNPSFAFLRKIAKAMNLKLNVSFSNL